MILFLVVFDDSGLNYEISRDRMFLQKMGSIDMLLRTLGFTILADVDNALGFLWESEFPSDSLSFRES